MTTVSAPPVDRGAFLGELNVALRGELVVPSTVQYEALTGPLSFAAPARPMAVVAARDAYDVATAVRLARAHGVPVVAHCSGYGVALDDETLLILTGLLDTCEVHPDGWARVGVGVAWRTLIAAAAEHGLAVPGSPPAFDSIGDTLFAGHADESQTVNVRAIDTVTKEGKLVRLGGADARDATSARPRSTVITAVELTLTYSSLPSD